MLFRCLWRNVDASCHKHFVVVSRHQQTPPLTTWLTDGEKNFEDMFIRFDTIHERDRQTDGQTDTQTDTA